MQTRGHCPGLDVGFVLSDVLGYRTMQHLWFPVPLLELSLSIVFFKKYFQYIC